MKPNELDNFITNLITEEVKTKILKEMNLGKKEVFHIKCEGEPVDTYDTIDEANANLDIYKKEHPDKEFIIDKEMYESDSDMFDKLDQMGEKLEEKQPENMEKQPVKVKSIAEAILHAKNNGSKKVRIGEDVYDVEECWKKLEEEEDICNECDEKQMDEGLYGALRWGKGHSKEFDDKIGKKEDKEKEDKEKEKDKEDDHTKKEFRRGVDFGKSFDKLKKLDESSNKRFLRLTETQLAHVISNIVKESVPGLTITGKAQKESKKENDDNQKLVSKKMKAYLSFDGNDNPEFPKPIGKGEKVARQNTKEQDEEVAKNFAGLQNLEYSIEPSDNFKERQKMSIEGNSKMGNAPTTENPKTKSSNGGEKPKDAESKTGNLIPTPETGKKIEKQVKGREEEKKKRVIYPKEKVPVKENKITFSSIMGDVLKNTKNN